MKPDDILHDLPAHTGKAVAHYWKTRMGQQDRQRATGKADQGLRSAVTGGAQMDGFVGASYLRRYEIFCRKLVLERHYTAAAFISSITKEGIQVRFSTPSHDLSVARFAKTLTAHLAAFA